MPKTDSNQQPTGRKQRRYDRLAVLDYIETYHRMHHYSPSQRMISRALAMSAPSVVHNAIHALERQGLLTITSTQRGWPAILEITPLGYQRLQEWRAGRTASSDEVCE
jgi:SOS-response transcriptional repressor LexA